MRLPISVKRGQTDTVVQPDICVVRDSAKLDKQGHNGAPDLAVEILSPGNASKEMHDKFELYEQAGVREYWLVQPSTESVIVYMLGDKGNYVGLAPITDQDVMRSHYFPELAIDLKRVFAYEGE